MNINEILKKYFPDGDIVLAVEREDLKEAIQEFADQHSIEFCDWKSKLNSIDNPECFTEVKYGISVTDYDWEIKSTKTLLQIFKNEKI